MFANMLLDKARAKGSVPVASNPLVSCVLNLHFLSPLPTAILLRLEGLATQPVTHQNFYPHAMSLAVIWNNAIQCLDFKRLMLVLNGVIR